MNNEPVAYVDKIWIDRPDLVMSQQLDIGRLFMRSGKEIKNYIPLYTHPVKELHLSLQKSKQTGELLAVTYTDDEHRIVEVLWQRPPVKVLTDDEILDTFDPHFDADIEDKELIKFARAILRKAQEK